MVYSSEELKDLEAGTGDYSATTRAPALNWQTLKPGEQLWPKAPQGWGQIMERLVALDAGLDWKELVARIWHEAYEVSSVAELGDRAQVAGRRLANLTAYLEEVVMEGREFPPPSDEELVAAIGWAFDGIVVAIPEPDPAALEAAQAKLAEAAQTAADLEQIEFGDAAAEPEEPAAS
jgi:hypothetical protein